MQDSGKPDSALSDLPEVGSVPENGDIRYDERNPEPEQDPSEEDDDNPYQESDEALPDDAEEDAIADNMARPE